jgi:broad specificity phosphatase PhoE
MDMTVRIFLVRHGETEWNRIHRFQGRSDVPLSQAGRDQAHRLALALRDEPIAAFHSSPLHRTMETARLIRMYHPSSPLIEEKGLIEMNLGDFDGMDARRWAEQYPEFRKIWQETPAELQMPGGESLLEVQKRALSTLRRVTRLYPPESTLLFCSHNFVILSLLCCACDIPLNRFRDLRQEPAALSILHKKGGRLRAALINERSHLDQDISSER